MSENLSPDVAKTREQLLEEVKALRALLRPLQRLEGPAATNAISDSAVAPFLALLLDHSPAPIYVTSLDARFLLVNRAWEEFFHLRRADVLGRLIAEVVSGESASQFIAINQRVLQTGEVVNTEEFADGPHGRHYFHTVKFPLRGSSGAVKGIAGISVDVTERKAAEELLQNTFSLLHAVTEGITDAVFVKDRAGRYLMINSTGARLLGKKPAEVVGQDDTFLFGPEDARQIMDNDRQVMATGQVQTYQEVVFKKDGRRTNLTTKAPYRDTRGMLRGVIGIARDVTEQQEAEGLLAVQQRILERISTDASLTEVLDGLARAIEDQSPGMLCSVLLLDADRAILRHGAAPSLPEDYCRAVDGLTIGPRVGSCGTAAYLGKPVIVADIATDPLWAPFRDLALGHDLRACWSTPIFSRGGKVLGTFAMYYRQPRRPAAHDFRLIEVSTKLAAIAIERKQGEEQLRGYADRLQVLSRRVLETQETERRQLARELHDEIGQLLTGISLNLQALKRGAGQAASPWLPDCLNAVNHAIQQTRNLSLDLRPSMLDDFGLEEALRWYTKRQAERTGLVIQLKTDLAGGRLPTYLETACFRISQEALTNVARHAQAEHVRIDLKRQDGEVRLTIQDTGVGFDPEAARRRAAHGECSGLLGMQDRVRLVGGQMAVEAKPGSGTTIRVRIPLASSPGVEERKEWLEGHESGPLGLA